MKKCVHVCVCVDVFLYNVHGCAEVVCVPMSMHMCMYLLKTPTTTTGLRTIRYFTAPGLCMCAVPGGTCGISSCTGGCGGWPAAHSHLCPPGQSAASRGCRYRSRSGCRKAPQPPSSHSERKQGGGGLRQERRRKKRGDMRKRASE